jgi:cytochrome oxidase assembly protein ShyY1
VARLGRSVALVGACLVLAGACTAAGVWQVQRYGEKRQANAELRRAATAAPVPVSEVLAVGRPVDPARRLRQVTAVGRYEPAGQVLVRQRVVDGRTGFLVVTPLRTAGGAVLVVRGFVPAVGAATQSPDPPAAPAGEVTVTGRVQPGEQPHPGGALPAGQVERIDVPELASRLGTPTYGGYLELVSSQPAESAGLTALPAPDLSNPAGGAVEGQHLAYIVQWFFFALLALAGPVLLPALERRARAAEAAAQAAGADRAAGQPAQLGAG